MSKGQENIEAHKFSADAAGVQRERQRKIQQAGGFARAEKIRERKALREIAEVLGEIPIETTAPDGSKNQSTLREALVLAQYRKAAGGDVRAAYFLANLMGEMVQKHDFGDNAPVVVLTSSEVDALKKADK